MARNGRKNANDALVVALAAGKTLADAADAGVSYRTARRRSADPASRQLVSQCRGEMAGLHEAVNHALAVHDNSLDHGHLVRPVVAEHREDTAREGGRAGRSPAPADAVP